METFGKRLIQLREKKGWSQYEAAERLGIKRPRYNSWENDIAKPRAEMLNAIASLYGVKPNYLLGFDESDQGINIDAPDWATSKDKRDIKKILAEDLPVMFDGKPLNDDDRQRITDLLTGFLWDSKEKNKETYGRKNNTSKDNKD
jgi:transcriptional regulator with XRE-family HTH domain